MPAIAPPDPKTAKFLNALNEFVETSPNQLSDEVKASLLSVGQSLQGYTQTEQSPGEKEAAPHFTDGTGEHYSKAATGLDQPSPGQREFDNAMEQAKEAAFGQKQA
jgi:hypothetical protein